MKQRNIKDNLREIYGAVNLDDAEYAKEEFGKKWDKKYRKSLSAYIKLPRLMHLGLSNERKNGEQ